MVGLRGNVFHKESKKWRSVATIFLMLAITLPLALAPGAHAQNDKKKKKNQPLINNDSANPVVPMTDEQQIDYMLSEYLGAWQLGDTERMHKNYSDDVSVVAGAWSAPILGWANYVKQYEQQRSHMQQIRMDRMHTYIKVNGTTAWACYQWDFAATMDGTPMWARGQTTLVLVKRETHWLIVHDHTSVVQSSKNTQPNAAPPNTPANTPTPENKPLSQ